MATSKKFNAEQGISVGTGATNLVDASGNITATTISSGATTVTGNLIQSGGTSSFSGQVLTQTADTKQLALKNTLTYVKTATGTSGQNTIVVSDNTNLTIGMLAVGTGIATNATVTNIAGTTVTLSLNNTGTVSGNITFSAPTIYFGASAEYPLTVTGGAAGTTTIWSLGNDGRFGIGGSPAPGEMLFVNGTMRVANNLQIDGTLITSADLDIVSNSTFGTNSSNTMTVNATSTFNANSTWNANVNARAFTPTSSTVPTKGMYAPTSNVIGYSVNGVRVMTTADTYHAVGELGANNTVHFYNHGSLLPTATSYGLKNTVQYYPTAGTSTIYQSLTDGLFSDVGGATTLTVHAYYSALPILTSITNPSTTITYNGFTTSSITDVKVGTARGYLGQQATVAGVDRWNLYMVGTAPNYINGSLGIGTDTNAKYPDTKLNFKDNMTYVASFTASISGMVMTVSAVASGTIQVGSFILNTSGTIPQGVYIVDQLTGTAGSTGTYTISTPLTVSSTANTYTVEGTKNRLRFTDVDTAASVHQPIGIIEWYGHDNSLTYPRSGGTITTGTKAFIHGVSANASNGASGELVFGTFDINNGDAIGAVGKIRIDATGNLLPETTAYDIGNSTLRWKNGYFKELDISGGSVLNTPILYAANQSKKGFILGTQTGEWRAGLTIESDGGGVPIVAMSSAADTIGNTQYVVTSTGTGSNQKVNIYSGGTSTIELTSSSNVGINTTNPTSRLVVTDSTSTLTFRQNSTSGELIVDGPTSGTSFLYFGDTADTIRGGIGLDSSTNTLMIRGYNNATKIAVDSVGRVLIPGTTVSQVFGFGSQQPDVQINGTSGTRLGMSRWSNDTSPAIMHLMKSRGTSVGTRTIVQNNDNLGLIAFDGDDGAIGLTAAGIYAYVDGTPGLNDMPGRLVLATTPDGGTSPTERMRIGSSGTVGIGASNAVNYALRVSNTMTGNTSANGYRYDGTIASDVTTLAVAFQSYPATQAAAFTVGAIEHFSAVQGTIGAGSSVTNQYGFSAKSSLIGATNNYGFFGAIPSGTNSWNCYMQGSASNYFAGNTLFGTTTDDGFNKLQVNGGIGVSDYIGKEIGGGTGIQLPIVGGGYYVTSASSATGYIKITLPVSWTNTMLSFEVTIYDYAGGTDGESIKLHIAGYNYSTTPGWNNVAATVISGRTDRFFNVRFGHDGSKCAIYIGESTSVWSYPQIFISNFASGYGATSTYENWATGWSISITATGGTITQTKALENVASHSLYSDDSNLLDGLDSSQFLRSDAADTIDAGNNAAPLIVRRSSATSQQVSIGLNVDSTYRYLGIVNGVLKFGTTSDINASGDVVWHAGNDGSGSGLDADTLDGKQASEFLYINGGTSMTGLLATKVTGHSVGSSGGDGSLSIRGDAGSAAVMTYHRSGVYAINLGLDTDNVFRLGGWSNGTNTYRWQSYSNGDFKATGKYLVGTYSDSGLFPGNGDGSSKTVNNIKVSSWYGIGFSPSISGQTVPAGEYAQWFDTRTGNMGIRGELLIENSAMYIKHYDTDWGANRWIHANGGLIGFLNSSGSWAAYSDNSNNWLVNGNLWIGSYGDWLTNVIGREQAYGGVGSLVFGMYYTGAAGNAIYEGNTYAGSSIYPAGTTGATGNPGIDTAVGTNVTRGGTALTGTWKALGRSAVSPAGQETRCTLFIRIS